MITPKPSYPTFNRNAYEHEMRKALRVMHGHSAFELVLQVGQDEASWIADYAGLKPEDRFDEIEEASKPEPKKYRAPDPKTSIKLSKEEVEICDDMALQTGRSPKEVRLDFARNKIALRDGIAGNYETYDKKMAHSMGAKYR